MNQQSTELCKSCTSRKLDFQRGLLCGITDAKPNFIEKCEHYTVDKEVMIRSAIKEKEEAKNKVEGRLAMNILLASIGAVVIKLILMYFTIDMMRNGGYVILNSVVIAFFCTLGALAFYKTTLFQWRMRRAISLFGLETTRWIAVVSCILFILTSYSFDIYQLMN